ncbi:MAG: NADH-quinone oxidoreductase subunit NuoK [Verrucomicrobiales bacterium]|mgnify:CR=1 FL=1|jgi:NADH-quinone oxidoreductase subunit K|nr:NADH-quinone oxidoreductase subunit NuoK [Verrucomicrobiales bacterium]|tara:strand:+ start:205 stop:531 length:327 start_codon:yes stop_codon:yes gene_type:complete
MDSALTLDHFLILSGLLFVIGLAGVLVRRNLIIIFMCLELMLSAANLTLVAFSRFNVQEGQPNYEGHVLLFFIITVAAAEVAVGLAIIVALFRSRETTDVGKLNTMRN